MPDPTPEAWAHIRYDYEQTDRPIPDICLDYGISTNTLRDRVRRWRWTPRRAPIPRDGPPALCAPYREVASPPPVRAANGGEGSGVGGLCEAQTAEPLPPTPLAAPPRQTSEVDDVCSSERPHDALPASAPIDNDPAAIGQRLQSAVARVLPAIEAIIARLATGPHRPREMEQAGRALSALTRTLRELNALLAQHNARAPQAYDDMPEDIDAFRLDLARRINAFCESRGDEIDAEAEQRS